MKYQPKQLIVPHSSGCRIAGRPEDIWGWMQPEFRASWGANRVERDLAGRRNPRAQHSWLVFHCGDPNCHAEMAVYWQYVITQLFFEEKR